MNYISMLNPISFYHLWKYSEGKKYIQDLINLILGLYDEYELLDYLNNSFNNVRSYVLFESASRIILIDYNLKNRLVDDDLAIVDILESTTNKKIYFILFNNIRGINNCYNNFINVFRDNTFIFSDSYDKQYKTNKELTRLLYMMDDECKKLHEHEYNLLIDK